MAKKTEFTFDSRDGKTKIHAVRWTPDGEITSILQIVHGMAEYIERYEAFAGFLTERGILVTGEDHLGHGGSVQEGGAFGYICERDPATVVVRDVHRLKKITQEEYPGIPYILLGHSMGSFMLRNYLCRYGTGIQGAVLCGTGSKTPGLIFLSKAVAAVQGIFLGQKHVAKMLDFLIFGGYSKKILNKKSSFDWLCSDDETVKKYLSDPRCGFTFTINGFNTVFELFHRINNKENLSHMPPELPVLFLAGKDDPVGNYGAGVKKAFDDFKEAGMNRIELKLYPGDRHEILNEKDKMSVYQEIYHFIKT